MSDFYNIVWLYISTILSSIIGFSIFLILSKNLSIKDFGSYSNFINLVITLTYLLDFGISNIAWKKISENKKNFSKVFWFSTIFYSLVSIFFLLISYLFNNLFIFITVFFSLFSNLFRAFLYGLKRMKEIAISENLSYFLKLLILLIFLKSLNLEIVYLSIFLHFFSSLLLRILLLKEIKNAIKIFIFKMDISLSFLVSSYLLTILPILYSNFSISFFSYFFGKETAAIIYFAYSITVAVLSISSPFYSALLPTISKNPKKEYINFTFKFSIFLQLFLFIILIIFLKEVIFLINKEYLQFFYKILILTFSFLFLAVSSVLNSISYALNKHKEIIVSEAIMNILLFSTSFFLNIFSFFLSFLLRFFIYLKFLKKIINKKILLLFLILIFSPIFLIENFYIKVFLTFFSFLIFIIIVKKLKVFEKKDKKTLKEFSFPKIFVQIFSKIF
jgi:O-antigen/teichoic acid export membrane protein